MKRANDALFLRRRAAILLVVLAAALAPRADPVVAGWGDDIERGASDELVDWIAPDLAAIARASSERRAALINQFVATKAVDAIEAVKRFREPALRPLFHALLSHSDWHVVHRALTAIERLDDGSALPRAFELLRHPEARLREKAAISCLTLWGRPGAVAAESASTLVATRLAEETDAHVRACLELLARRVAGASVVERLAEEVRVVGPEGLDWTPFLRKMESAHDVAPGVRAKPVERLGTVSAASLPVATRWTSPLLGYGRETVPVGRGLQPFGFLRNGGSTVHTGRDVGAFLDGAGIFACAAGVVRLVYTGSDMGTLFVLEHRVSEDQLGTVIYMHGAGVAFVRAGDRVEAGQLLGSLGLGFSFENGGHFSHLHLGMARGPFDQSHCHGYEPVGRGLEGWDDPAVVLADRIDRSRAPLDEIEEIPIGLAGVAASIRAGQYAAALREVVATLATCALDAQLRADATRIRVAIEAVGHSIVTRARARRAKGDPVGARALLTKDAGFLVELPGGDEPAQLAATWDADPGFRAEVAMASRESGRTGSR